MSFLRSVSRTLAALGLLLPALAFAAEPITGVVTNKTTGKPAGGDEVVLIQLQQGMQEPTRGITDSRGRFSLAVPDDGTHLVRVTHQKATYFQPVQPGVTTVAVTVYDAAPQVEGVHTNVMELHIEAAPNELHVVEVLQVLNDSTPQRAQFGPSGFDFYLPPGALIGRTGAITQGGMPVQTPAVPRGDPGHFGFLFPLRPGETQFGIGYTLPYTGKFTFTPRLTSPVKTFAILLAPGMKLTAGARTSLVPQPNGKGGTQTFLTQDLSPSQSPEFTVSGAGTLTDSNAGETGAGQGTPNAATANPGSNADASAPPVSNSDLAGGRGLNNPLNEGGDRDPWAKYKWWILAGLALLLAGAAGVLLRKPSGRVGAAASIDPLNSTWSPAPKPDGSALLNALKEEMFALETERLQNRVSEPQYQETRAALDLILRRALEHSRPSTSSAVSNSVVSPSHEPALTVRDRA